MSTVGSDAPNSQRQGPPSVSTRLSRPQQNHRKLNPASGNTSVTSGRSNSPRGPTSTHTAFAPSKGVFIPSIMDDGEGVKNVKPYKERASNAIYDDEENVWISTALPKAFPDKREDVHYLEEWVTERLSALAMNSHVENKVSSKPAHISQQQLDVLNKGFFELVRQVGIQCSDRAELMLRMWRASHELFENVIRELSTTVTDIQRNAESWKEKHDLLQKDMDILIWKHSRELENTLHQSKTHKSEDSAVYREMQDELYQREKDMNLMEATLSDLSIWFPNFQKYASSNLRKQLPPALDMPDVKVERLLPQDYFENDLERAKSLLETLTGDNNNVKSTITSDELTDEINTEEIKISGKSEADDVSHGNRLRELVVDNQLQEIVLKENQHKLKKMEEKEMMYRKRIAELSTENINLQQKAADSDVAINMQKVPCFLKNKWNNSVSAEVADYYIGKRHSDTNYTITSPGVVSVGDLQASLHKCCMDFLSNKMTLNWHIQKGCTYEGGQYVPSNLSYWRLVGTMGGVHGPEMRINTFETLYSYHLLHQTRNKRAARDCLKKTVWSALLWKNKMGIMVDRKPGEGKTIFNSVHAQTSTLPRQLGENEKPFVLCMTRLFGFFRNDIENVEILTNLYFHVFIRSFSTLQRYMKPPDTSASVTFSASNLFVPSAPCLIPVEKTASLLKRLLGEPHKTRFYRPVGQRRYSRAISLSVTEKISDFDNGIVAQPYRTWWTCLPNNILIKVNEDIAVQSQKYSSLLVDAYDIVEILWKHVLDYYQSLHSILENIYVFLEAVTSGPVDPMFCTLLLSFLETKDSHLSPEHKVLSSEFISLNCQDLLNPSSFADTILSKPTISLTGLHILFNEDVRLTRELRREGLDLLSKFKSNFIKYEKDADLSLDAKENAYLVKNVRRLTVIGRYNRTDFGGLDKLVVSTGESKSVDEESSFFSSLVEDNASVDSTTRQFDVLLSYAIYCFDEELTEAKDDAGIPYYMKFLDVYCALNAMKCVAQFNTVSKTICPIVDVDRIAKSIRHREVYQLKSTYYAWCDFIAMKRQRDPDLSDSDDDDEPSETFNTEKVATSARRPGRTRKMFTVKQESIKEEE